MGQIISYVEHSSYVCFKKNLKVRVPHSESHHSWLSQRTVLDTASRFHFQCAI